MKIQVKRQSADSQVSVVTTGHVPLYSAVSHYPNSSAGRVKQKLYRKDGQVQISFMSQSC